MQALKNPAIQQPYRIECQFDRSNSTYKPDQLVTGSIGVSHNTHSTFTLDIESIVISVWGGVSVQKRQSKPETEEMARKAQPIVILNIPEIVLCKSRTITQDSKLSFRFKLEQGQHKFLQTYIGVYLGINYSIKAHVKINSTRKIEEDIPFYIQVPKAGRDAIDNFTYPKKKHFMVVSGQMKGDKGKVPVFKVKGELESEYIFFNDDLNGLIIIDLADTPIRSIDLQMLRVERIEVEGRVLNEKTQIQLIQVCDGNVTRNLEIPLYMILPRYYSCPSVKYLWCQINFEVNLQIIFKDGYKVLVNLPLKLIRS